MLRRSLHPMFSQIVASLLLCNTGSARVDAPPPAESPTRLREGNGLEGKEGHQEDQNDASQRFQVILLYWQYNNKTENIYHKQIRSCGSELM